MTVIGLQVSALANAAGVGGEQPLPACGSIVHHLWTKADTRLLCRRRIFGAAIQSRARTQYAHWLPRYTQQPS